MVHKLQTIKATITAEVQTDSYSWLVPLSFSWKILKFCQFFANFYTLDGQLKKVMVMLVILQIENNLFSCTQ